MALPVYIAIEREDSEEIISIIEETFKFLEDVGKINIPRNYIDRGNLENGEFGSVDWYVDQAWNLGRRQVNSSVLWQLFENEPWQQRERHHEMFVLEKDLYAPDTNFIFGQTIVKIAPTGTILPEKHADGSRYVHGFIQSVHRLRGWYRDDWGLALTAVLLHEEGHFFGAPNISSPSYIKNDDPRMRNPLDEDHCNNRACIMEQVNVSGRPTLGDKISYLLQNNTRFFCDYDLQTLKTNLQRLYRQPY